MCLEGFLFGKLFVLCFSFHPAKEVQLFPNIRLIFPVPIDRVQASDVFVFCILCLLYVLCAATAACDLLANIFRVSNNLICKNIILASVVQNRSGKSRGSVHNVRSFLSGHRPAWGGVEKIRNIFHGVNLMKLPSPSRGLFQNSRMASSRAESPRSAVGWVRILFLLHPSKNCQ